MGLLLDTSSLPLSPPQTKQNMTFSLQKKFLQVFFWNVFFWIEFKLNLFFFCFEKKFSFFFSCCVSGDGGDVFFQFLVSKEFFFEKFFFWGNFSPSPTLSFMMLLFEEKFLEKNSWKFLSFIHHHTQSFIWSKKWIEFKLKWNEKFFFKKKYKFKIWIENCLCEDSQNQTCPRHFPTIKKVSFFWC